ncbi:MAG TPA: hypothetical protein VJH68_05210 [Candidatus Nanoarchaeia archaeon]|uniref:Uncharacterized protein n=1 Tax=Candidatus Yanofskybacteria bacterium GW2011_GWC2_37_9 TaxID=1619028 RepID=A0A0G0KYZ1_9BACT|nr:MAG: hypothetical protein US41_C0027G0003 [Parcubacteria group bacterium GW2011_GWB1_37_13]KKQ45711.1 MAG: hypothetical protein US65_C0050G0002 [Candidatus Yanofskybacteria bacterium GW2011_GWC2_37_9]HLC82027.1 hypothetical protein [Candidatus Nanoarchaeia archaeon]
MKDKALIELIIVLILVGFGFWALYKDSVSNVNNNTVNDQEIIPSEDVNKK